MASLFNCILIAETGCGKSSLGNYALGIEDAFQVSPDPESCTKETIRKISQLDPHICIVDTPGLMDSSGRDKIHYEQMLNVIKEMKELHFILLLFNFTCPRLSSSLKYMIKFLCNVFPKNFAHHVGIVFTHYDHDYQMKINRKKDDPRTHKKKFIKDVMELISETTNEELFLGPPVYFLDSYIRDDNSNAELMRLLAFAKSLKPIKDIRANCDLKIKKEEEEFDVRTNENEEGSYIVTYIKKYRRKKFTDYDNNITYSDWELIDTNTQYRDIPVRETVKYIYEEREDKKDEKEEQNILKKEKEEEEQKRNKKLEICDKVVKGGYLGTLGGVALTIGGALLTPICPVVGPAMMATGLTAGGVSEATMFGGIIADGIISKK